MKRLAIINEDGTLEIGGVLYELKKKEPKDAPRIKFYAMYDRFIFDQLEAKTPDDAVEEWLAKYSEDQMAYCKDSKEPVNIGRPDLCPMSIIYGPKEDKRFGPMVRWRNGAYDKAQLEQWRVECNKAIADMNAMLAAATLDLSGLPGVPERETEGDSYSDGFNAALDAIGVGK